MTLLARTIPSKPFEHMVSYEERGWASIAFQGVMDLVRAAMTQFQAQTKGSNRLETQKSVLVDDPGGIAAAQCMSGPQ